MLMILNYVLNSAYLAMQLCRSLIREAWDLVYKHTHLSTLTRGTYMPGSCSHHAIPVYVPLLQQPIHQAPPPVCTH